MEKYGFVYIWFDRKHKRYYIGSHWGTEDDGYVCSSVWMKNSYKRRPHDFKRRILKTTIKTKLFMFEEEKRWLKMIKVEEIGKRYYNLSRHDFDHWSKNENKSKSARQKMSDNHWSKRPDGKEKAKMIAAKRDNKLVSIRVKKQWKNATYKEYMAEQSRKRQKQLWANPKYCEKMKSIFKGRIPWNKGKANEFAKNTKWYTNGIENKRCFECPEGFWPGRNKGTFNGRKHTEESKQKMRIAKARKTN